MAEKRIKGANYIVVQGWMILDLGLKGNELLIYAIIYGFSQVDGQAFTGSHQYLADWTNSTKRGVIKCLKSLIEKGLIKKITKVINGVKFCEYSVTEYIGSEQSSQGVVNKVHRGSEQSSQGGSEQSSHNNIDIYNLENNIDYTFIIYIYNDTCKSLPKVSRPSKKRKQTIEERMVVYKVDDFKKLFEKAESSSYLTGNNKDGWKATFDWLIDEDNMAKVLEGNYDNRPKRSGGRKEIVPSWMHKEQQNYDFDELEKVLLENDKPDLSQRVEDLKKRIGGI